MGLCTSAQICAHQSLSNQSQRGAGAGYEDRASRSSDSHSHRLFTLYLIPRVAWAVSEELLASGAYCLFSTHFRELAQMEHQYPTAKTQQLVVLEESGG